MTNEQIDVFKELIKTPGFAGKDMLSWVLWRNISEPKLKIGDCYKVTDRGHSIWKVPVVNFNGKIIKSYCYKTQEMWYYELELVVRKGDKEYTFSMFKSEAELIRSGRCEGNLTIIEEA